MIACFPFPESLNQSPSSSFLHIAQRQPLVIMSETSAHTNDNKRGVQTDQLLTSGPARFIVTNNGSEDNLALLVTRTFLDKLNDMFEQERDLNAIRVPANHARMDIEVIENSTQHARNTLEAAQSETEREEIKQYLAHQEPRLLKLQKRKRALEEQCTVLKLEISRSGNYAHYVLQTAMESANLLRKSKPSPPPPSVDSEEDSVHYPERQHPVVQQSHNIHQLELSPEQKERQAAYEELRDRWHHLEKIQRLFAEREYLYQEELADYQRGSADGLYDFPQSELDRRHVHYGMQLTGALIEAESLFERARERADALGVGSAHSNSSCDSPDNELQVSAPMINRNFIEAWRAEILSGSEEVHLDDIGLMTPEYHDALELVDISDSMSARETGEFRRKIDRWQEACGVHRQQMAETVWTANDDAVFWRRHSA